MKATFKTIAHIDTKKLGKGIELIKEFYAEQYPLGKIEGAEWEVQTIIKEFERCLRAINRSKALEDNILNNEIS